MMNELYKVCIIPSVESLDILCAREREREREREEERGRERERQRTDLCFAICKFSQAVLTTLSNLTHNLIFISINF